MCNTSFCTSKRLFFIWKIKIYRQPGVQRQINSLSNITLGWISFWLTISQLFAENVKEFHIQAYYVVTIWLIIFGAEDKWWSFSRDRERERICAFVFASEKNWESENYISYSIVCLRSVLTWAATTTKDWWTARYLLTIDTTKSMVNFWSWTCVTPNSRRCLKKKTQPR